TNVFVRDALTDTTTLVNRASGTSGAAANGISGPVFRHVPVLPSGTPAGTPPAISANGQVVAFPSTATNPVPGDTNNHLDVFVRNLVTGTTTLVSVKSDGTQVNADSSGPRLSTDGNRVAFVTKGQFDPADTDALLDVYVRDIAAGTTTLVSRATGAGGAGANKAASDPAISGDGNRVAFVTPAQHLAQP